jgi:16S rRNA (guanine527-N7)-methyltransferase
VSPEELLARGLVRLGIACTPGQLEALESYRAELERWNRAYGLVKASGEELVVRHFLDSLAGLPLIAGLHPRRTLLDVGSGAGFPGIPLAVFLPDCAVTLLERSSKRAAFLANVVLLLGLRHVRVEEKQLAELTGRFDLVTLRGFSPLARELHDLLRVLSPEGHLVAYKGRRERVQAELRAAGVDEGEAGVHPLKVPFLEAERHLVIINSLTKPGGRATI